MTTRTETTEGTEERIFEAARKVFARKGRDGARMQEIADEAGINRALLHYYFRSKQGLFEAVFEYMFEQYMRSFDAVLEHGQPFGDLLRRLAVVLRDDQLVADHEASFPCATDMPRPRK